MITKLLAHWELENKTLTANKEQITKQNNLNLQVILLAAMGIFSLVFLYSIYTPTDSGYGQLSMAYLLIDLLAGFIYILMKIFPKTNSLYSIYSVYTISIVYCAIVSGILSPNYVSVTILAILFQIPILFLDKSWRLNLFMILGSLSYLMMIIPFKDSALFIDEVVNTIVFSTISIIIGSFVRQAKIENFIIKEELDVFAHYDGLTGVYNRRKLFEDLYKHEKEKIVGIAMVDVDYFKRYNDTYGHQKGDECLKAITRIFLNYQVQYNMGAYRYGGEEFIILFRGITKQQISNIAYEILKEIENMNWEHSTSKFEKVTASIGISFVEDDNEGYEAVISKADKAMYVSKTKGRNRVTTFTEELKREI